MTRWLRPPDELLARLRRVRQSSTNTSRGRAEMPSAAAPEIAAWCAVFAEDSPVPIALTTGRHHVVAYANEAFAAAMRGTVAGLTGRSLVEGIPGTQTGELSTVLDLVYESGLRARAVDAGGAVGTTRAYATFTVWPIRATRGRPAALLVQMNVTTDDVQAREDAAVGASELAMANRELVLAGLNADATAERAGRETDLLNALLTGLHEGVIILDATGRVLLVNDAAKSIWGLPESASATEIHFNRLLARDGTPLLFDRWPTTRARHAERFNDEEYALLRDGELRRLLFSGSAVHDAQGQLRTAIVTIRDVTQLRRLEQLREDHAALVSHDLRTPLSVVLGYAQRLRRQFAREGSADREEVEAAAEIEAAARRMNALIENLLDSNRLAAGGLALNKEHADLVEIVVAVARNVPLDVDRKRVEITAPREALTPLDTFQIDRVVSNLLGNALSYSPAGSPVRVDVTVEPREVILSITDEGRGIAAGDLGEVFNRYSRIVTRDQGSQSGGYGLGLYISRLIVEAHGGRIWVESEVGKGSTFGLALPLVDTGVA